MKPLRKKMIAWMELKNYSASTIKCYVNSLSMLARYYDKCPSQLTEEQVADYMNDIVQKRGYRPGSISGAVDLNYQSKQVAFRWRDYADHNRSKVI